MHLRFHAETIYGPPARAAQNPIPPIPPPEPKTLANNKYKGRDDEKN